MSRRARELDALNLGQGFPDYDIDPRLTELVAAAMSAGHNQYAPMEGLLALRERIAATPGLVRRPGRWPRRAGEADPRAGHRGAVRRGIRARGVRRRPAHFRADASGARVAQPRSLFLRQDPARHRPARRVLRGAT